MDFKKGDLVRFKADDDLAIVVDVARVSDAFATPTARVVWLSGGSVGCDDRSYYLHRSFELVAERKA